MKTVHRVCSVDKEFKGIVPSRKKAEKQVRCNANYSLFEKETKYVTFSALYNLTPFVPKPYNTDTKHRRFSTRYRLMMDKMQAKHALISDHVYTHSVLH